MSPMQKVLRRQWVEAALRVLDQDRLPPEESLTQLAARLGVSKGSFYSHFRAGGRAELYEAVVQQWLADQAAALPGTAVGAVRDPLDRIRLIRASTVANAVRNGAMRRWAAAGSEPGAQAAADAVDEADQALDSYLVAALTDLGLTGAEPVALAAVLGAALQTPASQDGPDDFETLLIVVARAATLPQGGPLVEEAPGAAPGQVIRYTAEGRLTADEQAALNLIAKRLAGRRDAGEDDPGHGRRAADKA